MTISKRLARLDPIITDEIKLHGLTHRVDIGGKHLKLFVAERLIATLPFNGAWDINMFKNVRCLVRRLAAQLKERPAQ